MTSIDNQLQALQNNVSKHFIFNTLNSINSFIIDNNAKIATDYLSKFGKLLRLVIDNSACEKISLAKELEALHLYMLMEKMRFNNKVILEIKLDADIDIEQIMVPPFLIQPYIEYAIWHLLANQASKNIVLEIGLKNHNKMMYAITHAKTNGTPKLRQALLPHQVQQQIKNTTKWITKNNLLFEVEKIDLYNEAQIAIAQKTSIILPITQ
jgi:LytS/YehU family sensor histidine kinase